MDNGSEPLIINGEPDIGDEFYEKIEAPKFVDLTAPDPFQPGEDRSWFCLRVGCDQNHDEEMDSEAIYKSFVLRVMAARSPNIRLRKALCRKDSGIDVKCPRTVPPKPSKSRVARTVLISSISKRIVDTKVKVKPLSKKNATPRDKAKRASIIAKALTTPRSKKQLAKPEAFRSVRNPKTMVNAASNNRPVAKALVFDSPKKAERTKVLVDLNTPMKNLCEGMKKLEITSSKKQALVNRPLETSRKQFRGREVKSRVFDGLNCQKDKVRHAESSKCLEKSKKENKLQKNHGLVCSERVANDINGIEIEEKTTDASTTASGNANISEFSRIDSKFESSSEERSSEDDDTVSRFQPPEENAAGDDKEKSLNFGNNRNDNEEMESDDKENVLASDNNRKPNVQKSGTENKIVSKHKNLQGNQETVTAKSKQSKESSTLTSNGAQCLKLKKPKPTNPKPFRLRTDERGILKEANFEKKLCSTLSENHNTMNEGNQMEGLENQLQNRKIGKEPMGRKMCSIPQRHTISSKQKLVASQKKTNPENGVSATTKAACISSALKRSKTVPKEPNFHSVHIPKSCTKRVVA